MSLNDSLFDISPGELEAMRAARPEPRRPKPLEDDGVASPFGAAMPENLTAPLRNDGFGRTIAKTTAHKGKRGKHREHYDRVSKRVEAQYPGCWCYPVDFKTTGRGGRQISKDLLGFMDLQVLLPGGGVLAINVTSEGKVTDHLREYTDPKNTTGQKGETVEENIRRFLALGNRFVIYGYKALRPGKPYDYVVREVTAQELDAAKARKRGGRRG
jgi:hypothetical protein